ncbi:MAG TPA: methylated-DNA--[protein]-cysteine S-methyltransferase [Candidatus Sulfomarinibacteraceae bacterium]|nr:methylated-DNA--[protein]-cysteine S-methyltransferase [Candidatus Sulfomarinibacteraceae bacterium]
MSQKKVWIGGADHERLGPLWVALSEDGLMMVRMRSSASEMREQLRGFDVALDEDRVRPLLSQLVEYLDGRRRDFDVPIDWAVLSDFQAAALQQVCSIPYGQTRTYQQIADELGQPGAARAVGRANATNPIPLVIPCHRVLATDGGLQGYGGAGGVETKAWLLQLEGSRLL